MELKETAIGMHYAIIARMVPFLIADHISEDAERELSAYNPLIKRLLVNRNIANGKDADRFLNPDWERDTHDPFLMHDMERAVERVARAIKDNERVAIYSDYDTDGIPGGVILHDFFTKIGYGNFQNYIPHRHKEGFGLNVSAIDALAKDGVTLLITVDCGIADVSEVKYANELSMNVIITDHHLPAAELPSAYAILDSQKKENTYPDSFLCGAAVAWKLVHALLERYRNEWGVPVGWEKWLLDMAGLATVADMVPLRGENRILARYGLAVLRKSPRKGLRRLLTDARANQRMLTEDDIGFTIGPRINAASRMGTPMDAFRLLATNDDTESEMISNHLQLINNERKGLVALIVKEVRRSIARRDEKSVIVAGNPNWRVGVLGIVANNIMEEYGKPTFIWGREGAPHIKGSCRSDGSVNIVDLMATVEEKIFIDSGGHEFAGGFSITHEHIHRLEDQLVSAYERIRTEKEDSRINVDAELSLDDVVWKTYSDIEQLAPFGIGNPKPIFLFKKVIVDTVSYFGKEKNHINVSFRNARAGIVSAIQFFVPKDIVLSAGDIIDLIASFDKSTFRGRAELRLRVIAVMNGDNKRIL